MTKTCIVCKKEPIPFDDSRSFHKFPMDNDLKTKWMNAIGKFSIKKSSRICSDHFDGGSYHNTDGYTTLRRLLSNAVPRIISSKESETEKKSTESNHNIKIVHENKITQSEENTQTKVNKCIVNVNSVNLRSLSAVVNSNNKSDDAGADYPSLSISPLETAEHIPYNDLKIPHDIIQECHQNNSGKTNYLKRNNPFKRNANHIEMKKIRNSSSFKTYRFTREKFSSDEAWAEFQEYATYMENKTAAAVKKSSRAQKKLTSLKMEIEKLKTPNEFTAAEYLQVIIT